MNLEEEIKEFNQVLIPKKSKAIYEKHYAFYLE